MFPHITTHTLLIKRMNKLYTHNNTTQKHLNYMCLNRDIRTDRYLGILLYLCLIFPILKQGRNYPDDTWVFMLVAVCQMGVSVRTPTSFEVKTSGIFLILNQRRNT